MPGAYMVTGANIGRCEAEALNHKNSDPCDMEHIPNAVLWTVLGLWAFLVTVLVVNAADLMDEKDDHIPWWSTRKRVFDLSYEEAKQLEEELHEELAQISHERENTSDEMHD